MDGDLQEELNAFTSERKFNRKGPLCVALVRAQQARAGRRVAVSEFVTRCNEIIEDVETDPSLKIEFKP